MAEHLGHVQVERLHAVSLLEAEMGVARSLSHYVHRCSLALGDALHVLYVFLVDEQSHAFLALVGDDFLGGKCLVANGQLAHVYLAAALLHQFGEAVQVAGGAVVVDAHHGIGVFLHQGSYQVVGSLLHFGIGALHGVQLNAAAVASRVHGGDRTAAQANAVVVAAYHHYLVAGLRLFLQAVAFLAVAHASCQHDDLVVGVLLAVFLMLEGEQ